MPAMYRGQGALEYLIIIAVVLGVLSVVVMLSVGAFGGQKSDVAISSCMQAAAQCKAVHYSVPNDPCTQCNTSCSVSGTEVFQNATICCKSGRPDMIYQGSSGCGLPGCVNNINNLRTEIFYDEFSSLNAWEGDKCSSPCSSGWYANTSYGYNNSNSAWKDAYPLHVINHTQSTAGYNNINVSFQVQPNLLDSGEFMAIDWYDGTAWTNLVTFHNEFYSYPDVAPPGWYYRSYLLPSSANNNPNIIIKVSCRDWHPIGDLANDRCAIDTFRITGISCT